MSYYFSAVNVNRGLRDREMSKYANDCYLTAALVGGCGSIKKIPFEERIFTIYFRRVILPVQVSNWGGCLYPSVHVYICIARFLFSKRENLHVCVYRGTYKVLIAL